MCAKNEGCHHFDCIAIRKQGGVGRVSVATFRLFQAVSTAEKIATIIDSIELCTACHAVADAILCRPARSAWR
jgi:hypothetical protein